ncbi:flavin reductase [Aquabacterium sp.]|uniref:flavin reductase n=1 Tax=Aquabacterium sp. TaxID=1872578 RepID=UPI003D03FA5A
MHRRRGCGSCSAVLEGQRYAHASIEPEQGLHADGVGPGGAPLIKECLANIECKVIDIIDKHHIVVLSGVAAYVDVARKERRMVHAVGDGTFIVDGRKLDRRTMMAAKLPPGV